MRLRVKVLLGLLISLIILNTVYVVYNIRKEIQFNTELLQKEIIVKDQLILDIYKNLSNLRKDISNVPRKIVNDEILLNARLQQVNIMVKNITVGGLGSGVSIKYKGKFYVLSAGHMANENTDKLELWENDNKVCDLEIVKYEYDPEIKSTGHDLILLKPKVDMRPKFYVELADFEPNTGAEIIIVGNPLGIEDVVSKGRVAIYIDNYMYFRDSTYFGNSGGGIYNNEGKLIGIMSHIISDQPVPEFPPFVLEGAVRLNEILQFLEGVN